MLYTFAWKANSCWKNNSPYGLGQDRHSAQRQIQHADLPAAVLPYDMGTVESWSSELLIEIAGSVFTAHIQLNAAKLIRHVTMQIM